jgi:hypothetical protein
MAGHEAKVDDLLDTERPCVRLGFVPKPGPLDARSGAETAVLEMSLAHDGQHELVVARRWLHETSTDPVEEQRIPAPKFGAPWLEARLLSFVARTLDA